LQVAAQQRNSDSTLVVPSQIGSTCVSRSNCGKPVFDSPPRRNFDNPGHDRHRLLAGDQLGMES
jgi:hypothetical protein